MSTNIMKKGRTDIYAMQWTDDQNRSKNHYADVSINRDSTGRIKDIDVSYSVTDGGMVFKSTLPARMFREVVRLMDEENEKE